MSGQARDIQSAASVLKRRRLVVLGAGLAGLIAGLSLFLLQPPNLTSSTRVLLPTPTGGNAGRDIETEIDILTSANILGEAGKAVTPQLSARQTLDHIQVKSLTTQLIQITANASTAKDAQALAQSVATSYIDYQQRAASSISATALAGLRDRQSKLQGSVDLLQRELATLAQRQQGETVDSASGRKDAQLKAQLETQQADVTLQLDKIKQQMDDGVPNESSAGLPTLIQDATPALKDSPIFPIMTWSTLGLLAGAGIASLILVLIARRDRRVRQRDEIADAVGSSVLASIRSRGSKSAAGWSVLLQSYEAGPVEEWTYRQLLRSLIQDPAGPGRRGERVSRLDHPRSLTIVTLAGDVRGLSIGPQLASFTASRGVQTRLITSVGGDFAPSLWASCTAERYTPLRANLMVGEVQPGETPDLTIVLAVVDRVTPQFGYSLRTEHAVLAVAAGAATSEQLARVAVAADDVGARIDGIVVADADPDDRTTGRHTAEERVRKVALPMRMTGLQGDLPADGGTRR